MDVPRMLLPPVVAGLIAASGPSAAPGRPRTTSGTSCYGAAMVALSKCRLCWITALGLVALGICIEFLHRWSLARITGRTWPPTRSVSPSVADPGRGPADGTRSLNGRTNKCGVPD